MKNSASVVEDALKNVLEKGNALVTQFNCSDVQQAHFTAQMQIVLQQAQDAIELHVAKAYLPREKKSRVKADAPE